MRTKMLISSQWLRRTAASRRRSACWLAMVRLFPLGAAPNRRIVEVLGRTDAPAQLLTFPPLRADGLKGMKCSGGQQVIKQCPLWWMCRHRVLSRTTTNRKISSM